MFFIQNSIWEVIFLATGQKMRAESRKHILGLILAEPGVGVAIIPSHDGPLFLCASNSGSNKGTVCRINQYLILHPQCLSGLSMSIAWLPWHLFNDVMNQKLRNHEVSITEWKTDDCGKVIKSTSGKREIRVADVHNRCVYSGLHVLDLA